MNELTLENLRTRFNLVCRFCLSDNDCFPLFLPDGNINKRLQKGIEIIMSKVDENDGLPNNICSMCLQRIEDFVDYEATCIKSYEILLKCITESTGVKNGDKQLTVEVLMVDTEQPDYIDDGDGPHFVAEEEQSAQYIEYIGTRQDSVDKHEELSTATVEVHDKRDVLETPATEIGKEVSHTSPVERESVHCITEDMNIKAINAKVVDYCYRNNRKIPIVQCMFCDGTYRGRNTLRKHLKIHYQIKNYSCSYCERTFADRTSLRLHEVRHSEKKSFKCTYCGRAYYSQIELNQHCIAKHGGRKYLCVVCSKQFPSKATLHDHSRVHQTDRPFVCSTCGKSFKRNRNLVRHFNSHQKNEIAAQSKSLERTATVAISCQYCEEVFKIPSELLEHLIQMHSQEYEQSHEGTHYCSLCQSKFNDMKDYLAHQAEHNLMVITVGEKTVYQCLDCGKQLRYRSLAEKHVQSHSTERRFQCNVSDCLKTYKFKVHLTRHMRSAHGEYQT